MKKIVFIIFTVFINSVFSQPQNSSALIQYNALLKSIEKLKSMDGSKNTNAFETEINRAKQKIETIKKYEPNFNTSSFEVELEKYEKLLEQYKSNKGNARNERHKYIFFNNKFIKYVDETLRGPDVNAYFQNNGDKVFCDKVFNVYQLKCKEFIDSISPNDVADLLASNYYSEPTNFTTEKRTFDQEIKSILDGINTIDYVDAMAINYYKAKHYELMWKTALYFFPNDPLVKHNDSAIKSVMNKLGSFENLISNVKVNKTKKMAELFPKPAVRKDLATENLFKSAFKNTGWEEQILLVNLNESDWNIARNSISGVILYRYQMASIVAKKKNGDCVLYEFTIKQDYLGNSFSTKAVRLSHVNTDILCENIK